MRWASTLLVLVVIVATNGHAADLRSLKVDYKKGVYSMRSEAWFDASLPQVFEVFRRWDYSVEFSSAIVESRDVEPDEFGRPQFYVKNRGCVLFWCKSMVRRGFAVLEENAWITASVNPDDSDFKMSEERWDFREHKGGTVVIYNLKMSPKFWIPPAIGPFFIKRKLKKDGGQAIDRIEAIAQRIESD